MKIRQKLAILVAVPLLAAIVFAALTVVTTGGEALQANRLRDLVKANESAGKLAYELQSERTLAVQSLLKDSEGNVAEKFINQRKDTKAVAGRYRSAVDQLTDVPASTVELLNRIDSALDDLEGLRERVEAEKQSASSAAFFYRIVIADLLTYRESVPQAGNVPSDVADGIRASNLLARETEYLSIQTETVLRTLERGEMTAAAYQKIAAANTGSTEAALSFESLAPTDWGNWLEKELSGADSEKIKTATVLEDEALRTQPGQETDIDAADWAEVMNVRSDKYQSIQERVDAEVVDELSKLRDGQYIWTAIQLGGVAVAVLLAFGLAIWLGGPVVRGLRRLRDSAHQVATDGLPRAVAQLDENNDLGGQTPEEFARQATPPVKIKGRDELADVGEAFNEVHREAIRVAAHQALLRLHIGSMFIRLARRGHSLAGRLTGVLDEAERNEQDPDRLERLFKLDHLVTLFGRTNDSLLVLGGAAPARARRSNATVGDVLTGAQGQIEQYVRVQIGLVDEGVSIKAKAVDDVVKLVAELLDNATQYSENQVNVTARLLADRLVIQISDRGMGIPPERITQLNARLATRNPLGLDSIQTMGLTVVGHIAAQHSIKVELRRAATGGTLAEVSLPVDIITQQAPPRAIEAGPTVAEQKPARGAPLFRRRGQHGEGGRPEAQRVTPAASVAEPPSRELRETRPVRRERDTSRPGDGNGARRRSGPNVTAGLPKVRFDFGNVPVDPGYVPDEYPTGVTPAVTEEPPTPEETSRPRQMRFGGHQGLDSGWQAAERAAAPPNETPAEDGLPKREPMARLVPGAVGPATAEMPVTHAVPAYRDPVSVGAAYFAYAKTRPGKRQQQPPADDSRNDT